jgi:hypothetical protein
MAGMEAFPDIGVALRLCCDFVAACCNRPRRRYLCGMNATQRRVAQSDSPTLLKNISPTSPERFQRC